MLENLEKQLLALKTKRINCLQCKKEIKSRLAEIRRELPMYSKISTTAKDLKEERESLICEDREEADNRKAWVVEDTEIKKSIEGLKKNKLKNVRVCDSRANL